MKKIEHIKNHRGGIMDFCKHVFRCDHKWRLKLEDEFGGYDGFDDIAVKMKCEECEMTVKMNYRAIYKALEKPERQQINNEIAHVLARYLNLLLGLTIDKEIINKEE